MSKKSLFKLFIGFLVLLFIPVVQIFPFIINDIQASSQIVLPPVADAMVRKNYANKNYGSWNDMTIGKAWNLGNYFSDAYSYIKFDLSSINSQSIIHSASLEVYQYVRSDFASGNYLVGVSKVDNDWSEMGITWGNKPSFSGIYAQSWVDGKGGQWFNPARKFTWDVTNLVHEWTSGTSNYGLVLHKALGSVGGFWCSRNYNNATCFDYTQPRLIINYSQNYAPNIPNPVSPTNMAEFNDHNVTLRVKDLGDPDGNLDGSWFYYKRQQDANWQVSSKQTNQPTSQFSTSLSDGIWQWRARSRDTMNAWSSYSVTRTFTIDTAPPSQPDIEDERDYTAGNQNTVQSSLSTDSVIGGVQYKFRVFRGESCGTFIYKSAWQEAQEFTISNLEHGEVYCYQVKSRDKLGNENNWSEFEKSRQDDLSPEFYKMHLSDEVFSPNQDGAFDTVKFSFEVFDQYFDKWEVLIRKNSGEIVQSFTGNSFADEITWDGKDANGVVVADSPFRLELKAFDLAGNEKVDDSNIVIVDNTLAALSISQPVDGAWFGSEKVTIAGICEPGVKLTANSKQLIVDENGIFEDVFSLDIGENVFAIVALDIVGNSRSKQISVLREIDVPNIEIVSPSGLVNDAKQMILLKMTDINEKVEQSGIDKESVYLSLIDPNGCELVLVNNGENIQTNLGHIETDCESGITGGSLSCSYAYVFDNPLQLDGDYNIGASVRDEACNASEFAQQEFSLDSHTYLAIENPVNGVLLNHSSITVSGEAEMGSKLTANSLQQTVTFEVDPSDERVSNCREVGHDFGVGWQGIKRICNFSIDNFLVKADKENDTYVDNPIHFEVVDKAGNILKTDRVVKVNLYAVSLLIKSNLEYISPNGDGKQDGMNFVMEAYNRDNGKEEILVEEWRIGIRSQNGSMVEWFPPKADQPLAGDGYNGLPPNYYFDGKDKYGNWLSDGEYSYSLWIKTTDGIEFETDPVFFYAKTFVVGEVIISNPKHGAVTTRGVINVQGQAPLNTIVTLCVDMIGIEGDCNDEQILEVDENGFFTGIAPLATKEAYLWAVATDEAGNRTEKSNFVKLILDFSEPLISVQALPSLTGINKEVILRSLVTENTEYIKIRFADYTDLSELPEGSIDWYKIGEVDNFDDEDLADSCNLNRCIWDYTWITPEVTGGVYEIRFIAKKAENYKTLSIGVRIDGTIPAVPTITKLINADSLVNLRKFQESYYTKSENIIIKGIAEPLTYVNLFIDGTKIEASKANAIGKWEVKMELAGNSDYKSYEIVSVSNDNVGNVSEISTPVSIILDKVAPSFEKLKTSNIYHRSGSIADLFVDASEALFSGKIVRSDVSEFKLLTDNVSNSWLGSFDVESDAPEGEYFAEVFIEDHAGNISGGKLKYIIDNTNPEASEIDGSNWGKYNGIYANVDIPTKGRLLPEYVIRNRELNIKGMAEENSIVEIWVNSYMVGETDVDESNCFGVTNAYKEINYKLCNWAYTVIMGANEQGNVIQTKVRDRAGNRSEISNSKLVYYDKTPPEVPTELFSKDYWDDDGLGRITSKQIITLNLQAERLSDIEIWVKGPCDYESYYFLQSPAQGYISKEISLGKDNLVDKDGFYNIEVRSTDAAGNRSRTLRFNIEKDTISPKTPNITGLYLCGLAICMNLTGEDNSKVFINNRYLGKADSNVRIFKIVHAWKYNTLYKFEIFLEDRAKNRSQTIYQQIKTPLIPMGEADFSTSGDPWAGKSVDHLPEVRFDVTIYPGGSYRLENVSVPAPQLTRIYTTEEGSVEIYGVAIPKYHELSVNIKKEFLTYNEAAKACNVGYFINSSEKSCMEGKMGIASLSQWVWDRQKSCFFIPFCFEKKKGESREVKAWNDQKFNVEHAMVSFHKSDDSYINHLWNDKSSGRFKQVYTLQHEVRLGDLIKTRVNIFGEFEFDGVKINYSGIDLKQALKGVGLRSNFSNTVRVPEKPFIFDVALNPMSHSSCEGYRWTSPYGYRADPFTGKKKFHSGVDLAKWGGCQIVSVSKGQAQTTWYAGNTVIVQHDSTYETRYGHAAYFIGKYPRVASKGESIMYMGQSGKATGVHLHFEVWEGGKHVDPTQYFNFNNRIF